MVAELKRRNWLGERSGSVRAYWLVGLLAAPALAVIIVYLLAFVPVIARSLLDPRGTTVTLNAYQRFFSPTYVNTYFVPTVRISILATLFALLLGYPLAYHVVHSKSSLVRKTILFAVILAFFVNSVVRAFSWFIVLQRHGVVNALLTSLGFGPIDVLFTELAVIVGAVHFLLPFTVLLMIGPIQDVKPDLVDAARNLGANEFYAFLRVVLPVTLPGIVNAGLLTFVLGLGLFVTPLVLGGGFVTTMAVLIYEEIVNAFNYEFGAAITVFLVSFALLATFSINRLMMRKLPGA